MKEHFSYAMKFGMCIAMFAIGAVVTGTSWKDSIVDLSMACLVVFCAVGAGVALWVAVGTIYVALKDNSERGKQHPYVVHGSSKPSQGSREGNE